MEKVVFCPVCKSRNQSQFLTTTDFSISRETFSIVRCDECGFLFTSPRPFENNVSKYYKSEDYISHSNSKIGVFNKIYQLIRGFSIKRKIKLLESLNPPLKTLLDYGCGTGEFLNLAQKNSFTCYGVEPSSEAAQQAILNYALKILKPDDLNTIQNSTCGVITLWHVLEHVYKAEEVLKKLNDLLCTGGFLIIAVPNAGAEELNSYREYWAAYDVPRHIYHFTQKALTDMVSPLGFEIQKIKPMWFDPFYISLLSEKYKTGKMNILSALFNGLKTTLYSLANKQKSSSLIYVFRKP